MVRSSIQTPEHLSLGGWRPGFMSKRYYVQEVSSDTMSLLISFRNSTPPQNRQIDILISNNKRWVDDFVEELTF